MSRNIDADYNHIPGVVTVYDMDGLHAHLEHSLAAREAEVPQAEDIFYLLPPY